MTPEYVTIAEAARRLGCSRDTVYAGIRAGTIPAIKITPNCIRIPRAAFDQLMRGESRSSDEPIQMLRKRAS